MGNWRWNLELLRRRWDFFNGKIFVAVAEDGEWQPTAKEVKKFLPQTSNVEVLGYDNDPDLRESATLLELLSHIHSFKDNEATLYAHSKGVTHADKPAVMLWTEALHWCNIDYFHDGVGELLEQYPVVGSFARYGSWKHFPKGSRWHFSGTFYWFRHDDLFRRDWINVPLERYTAEAFPSLLYNSDEIGVAFYDGVQNLYNYKYIQDLLLGKIKAKKYKYSSQKSNNGNGNGSIHQLRTIPRAGKSKLGRGGLSGAGK